MEAGTPVVVDKSRSLSDALAALTSESGLRGALLVTRDGLCVVNGLRGLVHPETFSAMAAATTGAAEAALTELPQGTSQTGPRVILESGPQRVIVVPASEELLLAVVSDANARLEAVLDATARAVQRIGKIVAE